MTQQLQKHFFYIFRLHVEGCWGFPYMNKLIGFLISCFFGFLVYGFLVSTFLGFLVSNLLGFLVSWFQSFLVSWILGFLVSKFLGLLVPTCQSSKDLPDAHSIFSRRYWSHIQDLQDFIRRIFGIVRRPSFPIFSNVSKSKRKMIRHFLGLLEASWGLKR